MTLKNWLEAARLRTLPLALASIATGTFLAAGQGHFDALTLILAMLTTLLLQIGSNYANDYGDSVHGADAQRKGPRRLVTAGTVTARQMQAATYAVLGLALVAGLTLLYWSLGNNWQAWLVFLGLGLASIGAAYTYTAGRKPYGYAGLGDLAVFFFFGFVGVGGSYYLYTQHWNPLILLPAATLGFFATGVLNVNNLRDLESDRQAGKNSLPVRLGLSGGKNYHGLLLALGWAAALAFVLLSERGGFVWLFGLSLPLFWANLRKVWGVRNPTDLDPYLKQLALSTLVFVLLFGLGWLLSA